MSVLAPAQPDYAKARNVLIQTLKAFGVLHIHYMRNSRTVYKPKHGPERIYRQWVIKSPEHEDATCRSKACMKLRLNT